MIEFPCDVDNLRFRQIFVSGPAKCETRHKFRKQKVFFNGASFNFGEENHEVTCRYKTKTTKVAFIRFTHKKMLSVSLSLQGGVE